MDRYRIEESVKIVYTREAEELKADLQKDIAEHVQKLKVNYESDVDEKDADKTLFKDFLNTLPSSGEAVRFLRDEPLGESFQWSKLVELKSFLKNWGNPEFEFFDGEVEESRKRFFDIAFKFKNLLSTYTGLDDPENGVYSISKWLQEENPDLYDKRAEELDNLATQTFKAYEEFVRIARKKLKV